MRTVLLLNAVMLLAILVGYLGVDVFAEYFKKPKR
jgi:hypothetical protein